MSATTYFHIAEIWDWSSQRDGATYTPQAYRHEGFIHLSYEKQLAATAGRYFLKRDDIVVLKIESADLDGEVVDENLLGGEEFHTSTHHSMCQPLRQLGTCLDNGRHTSIGAQLVGARVGAQDLVRGDEPMSRLPELIELRSQMHSGSANYRKWPPRRYGLGRTIRCLRAGARMGQAAQNLCCSSLQHRAC